MTAAESSQDRGEVILLAVDLADVLTVVSQTSSSSFSFLGNAAPMTDRTRSANSVAFGEGSVKVMFHWVVLGRSVTMLALPISVRLDGWFSLSEGRDELVDETTNPVSATIAEGN